MPRSTGLRYYFVSDARKLRTGSYTLAATYPGVDSSSLRLLVLPDAIAAFPRIPTRKRITSASALGIRLQSIDMGLYYLKLLIIVVIRSIMETTLYSIEDLSGVLKLHPKTILRFIHEGKIKARKIGRSWRVSRDALKEYAHAELVTPGKATEVVDYGSLGERMRVSAVIEIDEQGSEEASRLSSTLMAALNCKDPAWGNSRFDSFYFPEARKAKYALYGTPAFIAEIMTMLGKLAPREGSGV
jgi:excisionase family DNA binding protein